MQKKYSLIILLDEANGLLYYVIGTYKNQAARVEKILDTLLNGKEM